MGTQWRIAMSGPTGLNYQPLFELLDRKGYPEDEWWQVFDDIRVLERSVLECMNSES